jgi:polar amino acid transport system substrate-binding protein
MKKLYTVLVVAIVTAFVLAACGPGGATGGDLLSQIKSRGYILVSTDPNYAPQSFLNTEGKRPGDTKCPSDALTTAEMQGFDVDVAAEIGKRLGVETCFATPNWDAITAGNWANKWDVSVGSMTVTAERQKVLDFTSAYYYTPAVVAVTKESGITSLDQLSGKALCVGASTTYDDWLNGKLDLPAENVFHQPPANATVVPLDTDQECAQSIQAGRKDFVGYVTSGTVIDQNIANGLQVVKVDGPVYAENLAVAIDRAHTPDYKTLMTTIDGFIKAMHTDGTLSTLSKKWFQADLTLDPLAK